MRRRPWASSRCCSIRKGISLPTFPCRSRAFWMVSLVRERCLDIRRASALWMVPVLLEPARFPRQAVIAMSDLALTAESPSRSPLANEVARRRTFAIISHPDAGKTTLTEKLLLFGGAINLAGQVKAKGERRNTRSDWMKIERDRGISVVTSVMTFEFEGLVFNLLDTPGHEDFSEDTYHTLPPVNSAVIVFDAPKGIKARPRKLFEEKSSWPGVSRRLNTRPSNSK